MLRLSISYFLIEVRVQSPETQFQSESAPCSHKQGRVADKQVRFLHFSLSFLSKECLKLTYAILINLDVEMLKRIYGDTYSNAYTEIKKFLTDKGFTRQQGSVYFGNKKVDVVSAITAIQQLSIQKSWFYPSIKDIRLLRVEDSNDLKPAMESVLENSKD